MHKDMNQRIWGSEASHRDRWLALLGKYGVGHPKSLHIMEVPGGLIQATIGEPPGRICLEGTPGNVPMFNLSPVRAVRHTREGRSFVSHMLHGDMTLMPCGPRLLYRSRRLSLESGVGAPGEQPYSAE